MSARVHLMNRDCLPPHEDAGSIPNPAWWSLIAVVSLGVLWTILE